MKIIEPFNPVKGKFNTCYGCRNAIFLAGPCPRSDFGTDWRYDAFSILEQMGFGGTVITPTNPYFKQMTEEFGFTQEQAREKQVAWERAAMHIASAIVFWVPRSDAWPARTTNYEFGEWYKKPRVFVGWPDGAEHNEYMVCKLKEQGKHHYSTLDGVLRGAVMMLGKSTGPWFTSDTHFSQQRTLELSRRPFVDVQSMDYEMISNWNKRVTMNDEVIHAGDFIDPEQVDMLKPFLSFLNFKTLRWVLGNYDRKIVQQIEQAAADGVHVGQGDMPVAEVRRRYPSLRIVGLSTHNPEQARRAIDARPDYIGVGPVFATPTKKIPDPTLGVETAGRMIASVPFPAVAIGGLNLDTLPSVLAAGAQLRGRPRRLRFARPLRGDPRDSGAVRLIVRDHRRVCA